MKRLTALVYEQVQSAGSEVYRTRRINHIGEFFVVTELSPLSQYSDIIRQLVVFVSHDNNKQYIFRDKDTCIELAALTSEHTLFMLKC